jgi:hypothetical protein
MTEAAQEQRQSSYEQFRDSVSDNQVRSAWQEADRLNSRRTQDMDDVRSNTHLSEEGIEEGLAQVEEKYASQVEEAYRKARELAQKRAEDAYKWSLPAPGGGSRATLTARDSTEVMAAESRAGSIKERIAKRKESYGKMKPSEDVALQVIREELSAVMDGSQEDAGTRVAYLAAVRAAEDTVGVERVLSEFRSDRHRRYAAEHEELAQVAMAMPSGARRKSVYPNKRRNVAGGIIGETPGMRRSASSGGGRRRKPQWK